MSIFETLSTYFQFPFVRYALIAGVLIALCASLLGVTLVLKRFSFIGDGLSHVAFCAMAIATVFSLSNNMLIVLPITIFSAILLLRKNGTKHVRGDAALAMISVGALALGYLILNVFSKSANLSGDVCSTLFGSTSILTLKVSEVWLCVGLSMLVLGIFTLFYNKIFAVTFDESFAAATGTPTGIYDTMIACTLQDRKYSIDFVSGRALRELEPAAQMYAKVVRLSELAAKGQTTDVLSDYDGGDGTGADAGILTLPDYIYSTYNALMESGWKFDDIDRMDMLGFLRVRAWNAKREHQKKEPRRAYIDEVWPELK